MTSDRTVIEHEGRVFIRHDRIAQALRHAGRSIGAEADANYRDMPVGPAVQAAIDGLADAFDKMETLK